MSTAVGNAPTRVQTAGLADGELLEQLPSSAGALSWVRRGDGLVGWGAAARLEVRGPDRFARAAQWWRELCDRWSVEDDLGLPGCGPVAFGSFTFDDDDPTSSVLVVPEVVFGRRADATWVTTVGTRGVATRARDVTRPRGLRYSAGDVSVTAFRQAVEVAAARIRGRELDKLVLAHDLVAQADDEIDARFLLHRLAEQYPDCWTFAVDGLVGATPELLLRRTGDQVLSRVLAGTVARGADAAADEVLRAQLLRSDKDLAEHRYAVESVANPLGAYCEQLSVPAGPSVLELANVSHLVTDVTGRLRDGASVDVLELAGALHPTAAVGGTPTDAAARLRRQLEPMDRGRYAGPVGWVDSRGDGEWGIALRCAQLSGRTARLFAGCGIVAGSDPDAEVLEAQTKFVPVRDALEALR